MNNPIIIGIVCAAAIVIFIVWLQVKTMRVNRKLKKEGKEPIPEQKIVNVIDWTRKPGK